MVTSSFAWVSTVLLSIAFFLKFAQEFKKRKSYCNTIQYKKNQMKTKQSITDEAKIQHNE